MAIADRYASVVRSANMRGRADTTRSDTDLLGAAGFARKQSPMAIALLRLLSGDGLAAKPLVEALANMLVGKAWAAYQVKLRRPEALDLAAAVLAWSRDGQCRACKGHGYQIIAGTPTVGEMPCPACRGTRRLPFDPFFTEEHLPLATWLLVEIEREQSIAGGAVMRALTLRLSLRHPSPRHGRCVDCQRTTPDGLMHSVILTIVFFSAPAAAQQSIRMETINMATCETLAEQWRRWPGGIMRVISATCEAR